MTVPVPTGSTTVGESTPPDRGTVINVPMSDEAKAMLNDTVMSNDAVITSLFDLSGKMEALASGQMLGVTSKELDKAVADAASLDATLADADMQMAFAKHGLTPFKSVEGLIKLREALVQAYRDNERVPIETRLKVAELTESLHKLEAKTALVVQAETFRAQTELVEAKHATDMAQIRTDVERETAKITGPVTVMSAGAEAALAKVEIEGKIRTAKINQKLLTRQKRVELFKKSFGNMQEMRRTIYQGLIKPARKWAFLVLLPLIMISNLVADTPGRQNTPVLGQVNRVWDSAYGPIRDGVVRVYRDHNRKSG